MKVESKFALFLQSLESKELIDFIMFYESCDIQGFTNDILMEKLGLPEVELDKGKFLKGMAKKLESKKEQENEITKDSTSLVWEAGLRIRDLKTGIHGEVYEYKGDIWPYAKGIITIQWDDNPDPEVVYISEIEVVKD